MTYRKIELTELLPADVIVTTDKSSPISSTIKKNCFLLFILVLPLFLSSCSPINKWRSRNPVLISGPIEIGPEWVEIIPPNPLVSLSGTSQQIEIYTEHDVRGTLGGKDGKTLILKNGKTTKIEAFLYGENGKEYELFINGDARVSIFLDNNESKISPYIYFPDGKYTKLRIRSETPIKVEKIEWSADYSIDEWGHLP